MKYFAVLGFLVLSTLPLSAQTSSLSAKQPSFAALTMDGTKIDNAALRDKVVVYNLWFINCPNCREEIKMLNQIVDQYKDNKDVVFIGLAASRKADLEKFLLKYPFKYQVVPSAEMVIFSQFGTPNKRGDIDIPFPMHYVFDRSGNMVVKVQGTKGVDAVKAELAKQFSAKNTSVK